MADFSELRNFFKIDFNLAMYNVLNNASIKYRISNIVRLRLRTSGTDKFDNKLKTDKSKGSNVYSNYTISLKKKKGQQTSFVNLKDKGAFQASIKTEIEKTLFEIDANFKKGSENIFKNFTKSYSSEKKFEEAIEGLSEKELNRLLLDLKSDVLTEIKKQLNDK